MSFIHDAADFDDLIRAVARSRRIQPALVEKDYWVTHTLWALHQLGLEIWFKGGTALSKGYGIIERFSEDVDLCIKPGTAQGLPEVASWTSVNKGPIAARLAFYLQLQKIMAIPGAVVAMAAGGLDHRGRSASYTVVYPGHFVGNLPPTMRPHVLVEVGDARVTPFELRDMSSFVHDWLHDRGQLVEFADNRPRSVRCLHPSAVLVEKLDAILRRYHRTPRVPHEFVRHYEDAARIILYLQGNGTSVSEARGLVAEMLERRQIAGSIRSTDGAFDCTDDAAGAELVAAHDLIAPMFWGPRLSMVEACGLIRQWLRLLE